MYNVTMISGWLGIGGVYFQRPRGIAMVARPRPGHTFAFGNGTMALRSGVQQQA